MEIPPTLFPSLYPLSPSSRLICPSSICQLPWLPCTSFLLSLNLHPLGSSWPSCSSPRSAAPSSPTYSPPASRTPSTASTAPPLASLDPVPLAISPLDSISPIKNGVHLELSLASGSGNWKALVKEKNKAEIEAHGLESDGALCCGHRVAPQQRTC